MSIDKYEDWAYKIAELLVKKGLLGVDDLCGDPEVGVEVARTGSVYATFHFKKRSWILRLSNHDSSPWNGRPDFTTGKFFEAKKEAFEAALKYNSSFC